MPKGSKGHKPNPIYRIIDANINRAREGLRVCEEITRFVLNSYHLTAQIKKIRHELKATLSRLSTKRFDLLKERDSLKDVGKYTTIGEGKRKDYKDVFFANIQRVKESLRVLEEFSKLIDKYIAERFKYIRYDIYDIEKKIAKRFQALCRLR